MKKELMTLAAIISMPVTGALHAQDLPSMTDVREMLRHEPVEAVTDARPVADSVKVPGGPLSEADSFSFKWTFLSFKTSYDIFSGNKDMGKIVAEGDGFTYKDASGKTVMTASEKSFKNGTAVTVKDPSGKTIGTITESDAEWGGNRAFSITDGAGKSAGATGTIKYMAGGFAIANAGQTVASFDGPGIFSSKWDVKIAAKSFDPRLAAMVLVYNEGADMREKRIRRIEDGPRGGKF